MDDGAALFTCLRVGPKYNDDYVRRLSAGIRRHLPQTAKNSRFVCFSDSPIAGIECEPAPKLPKWWGKTALLGMRRPMIFFDLDVVIVGSLVPLLEWRGFGTLRNTWGIGFNSSVMKLTGSDEEYKVWARFTPSVMEKMRGDQDWLNVRMPTAKTFPRHWFPCWKTDRCAAMSRPPFDAIAINCHGFPKPHKITSPWLIKHWTGDGLTQ